jgi:hypothetical protein
VLDFWNNIRVVVFRPRCEFLRGRGCVLAISHDDGYSSTAQRQIPLMGASSILCRWAEGSLR